MPKSVEMPEEFAEEGYELELTDEFAHVHAPDGTLLDSFSLWGRFPLESAVAASCRARRDRTGRHRWRV